MIPSMKNPSLVTIIFGGAFLFLGAVGIAHGQKLPVVQGKKAVATVNGEPISLEEFNRELVALPAGIDEGGKKGRENKSELLQRLINSRLIIQEGRKIGLDELPEIKSMVDVYSKVTLREQLMERLVKDIQVDEKEIERLYRDAVKEWKIRSVVFEKEDAARRMVEELKAGKDFDQLSKRMIGEGTGKAGEEMQYIKAKDVDPQIVAVVSKMEPGSASPVIPGKSGFVILKLEDIRYPENPKEKERAGEEARKHKKVEVLKDYNKGLVKKYAKIHQEVIEGIDYESKEPGFQQLLKDTRVIAEIKGEKPITVGELSQEFRQQFYHGVDRAIEGKKLNSKKIPALEDMVYKRVFRKEALRLGLDKSENYKDKVKGYENSVIFGAFMQKAVIPGIKLTEDEVTKYYHEHIGEYTFPEMMRIRSLIFFKRSDAEGAIEKLRKGTDFQWLLANSEGQVDKNMKDLLRFEGNILVIKDLPDGMRKVISGAKSGDSRLYAGPEGYFYVLSVQEAFPSKAKSYPEAKEEIAKKVFDNKVNKAVEDWVDKLRAVAEIKIYLKNNN